MRDLKPPEYFSAYIVNENVWRKTPIKDFLFAFLFGFIGLVVLTSILIFSIFLMSTGHFIWAWITILFLGAILIAMFATMF
jgi:NhaP-type Na+/H+ or K+/H+ antiporter